MLKLAPVMGKEAQKSASSNHLYLPALNFPFKNTCLRQITSHIHSLAYETKKKLPIPSRVFIICCHTQKVIQKSTLESSRISNIFPFMYSQTPRKTRRARVEMLNILRGQFERLPAPSEGDHIFCASSRFSWAGFRFSLLIDRCCASARKKKHTKLRSELPNRTIAIYFPQMKSSLAERPVLRLELGRCSGPSPGQ